MVAHEKRNPAQLFCAVPTQNDLALSSLLFPPTPHKSWDTPGIWTTKIRQMGREGNREEGRKEIPGSILNFPLYFNL